MRCLSRSCGWLFLPVLLFSLLAVSLQAQEEPGTKSTVPATAAAVSADASTTDPSSTVAPAPTIAPPPTNGELKIMADTMWVMITGMLVFFMNLGFGCVESGFCRAKNCVNILSKNFIVFAVSTFGFWLVGWGVMFGDGNPWVGLKGLWMVGGADNSPETLVNGVGNYVGEYGSIAWTGVPLAAKFFFQLVFAGTAATIVSGAVAERIKYLSFIVFSLLMAIVIYPVVGHWIWGGGYLAATWNFFDFAGSTQVHSIGGWSALTGILILGARRGKYGPNGKVNAIPGHNMTAAFIGCLVLWFGWFGFNPGSTMAADPAAIAEIALTTNLAAAMATISATAVAWIMLGKPDIGMTLNGCLAGLVAITAPCAFVTPQAAALIGLIAGVLVVLAVMMFDKLRIDDPVGATSVHLVNGVFGTLCVGLFAEPTRVTARCLAPANTWSGLFYGGGFDQLIGQAVGVGMTAVYVCVVSAACWLAIKYTMGLRVSEEEEIDGLDHGEHGNEAYHGFVMNKTLS